jgi:hypothetical protein
MQEDIKTFTSGAQSSSQKAGYWMIPFVVLRAVAQRFDLGALKYDAHNWKRGCNDPDFMRDRFNHMIEHAFKFTAGGDEEDDIEGSIIAVLINAVFLTYWTIMHRAQVEAAFPTEAPDVLRAQAPLQILREASARIPPPQPVVERHAVAEIPKPAGVPGLEPVIVKDPIQIPSTKTKLQNQKPLPQDAGNQQFC